MLAELPTATISRYNWAFWARPKQLPPAVNPKTGRDWLFWLILAGRGFGKTRTGAQWVIHRAKHGPYFPIALVGQTKADVRDTMIEVSDGSILKNSPPHFTPEFQPSKRRLVWPNGMVAVIYSGDEPDQLRGPQHGSAWVDELAKFKYPQETLDNLEMGLRLGPDPKGVITTTPRPISVVRQLLADDDVAVTTGSSYENEDNLSPVFVRRVIKKFEGTTLGRQELHAEVLDEVPGALWKRQQIDDLRRGRPLGRLVRVGVGVDPTVSEDGSGDECGIVVGAIDDYHMADGTSLPHGYVLADRTVRGGPRAWAAAVVQAFHEFAANCIVAEGNQGGALVREVLEAADARHWTGGGAIPVEIVHASRAKVARAEPVAMLYEKGRVHHLGTFPQLEDEQVTWLPGTKSPNRIDGLVWILTALMLQGAAEVGGEIF